MQQQESLQQDPPDAIVGRLVARGPAMGTNSEEESTSGAAALQEAVAAADKARLGWSPT